MSKHLMMRDRVIIQYEIEHNHYSTLRTVSERIKVNPSFLYREILRNRSSCGSRSAEFNHLVTKFPSLTVKITKRSINHRNMVFFLSNFVLFYCVQSRTMV